MTGLRRYANKRDAAEQIIFDALKAMGCKVYPTNKPFDAIICHRGKIYLVECKTPITKAGKVVMSDDQTDLIDDGWPVAILKSAADAVAFVRRISKLTVEVTT
jgi:hypothetical protein